MNNPLNLPDKLEEKQTHAVLIDTAVASIDKEAEVL